MRKGEKLSVDSKKTLLYRSISFHIISFHPVGNQCESIVTDVC